MITSSRRAGAALAIAFAPLVGCAGGREDTAAASGHPPESAPRIVVSARGGTPKLGPGDLYNGCERIWCLAHEENFPLAHFLDRHVGWILHDDAHGDVFVPVGWTGGPGFPGASPAAVRLCGRHLHPFTFGKSPAPVRSRGFSPGLGYGRDHFRTYGIRLEACCLNGLAWSYVHTSSPRQFRFEDLEMFRDNPTIGWQSPVPQAQRTTSSTSPARTSPTSDARISTTSASGGNPGPP